MLVNFDVFYRFEDITNGERPPADEEEPAEEKTVPEPPLEERETHPTGGRRITGKPRFLVKILVKCENREW